MLMPSPVIKKAERHQKKHVKKWWCEQKHQSDARRCLLCRKALNSGRAEANQSQWTYASWAFAAVAFISMPVRSSVALITGSVLWGWGPEAMLKDWNPLQDPVISSAAGLLTLILILINWDHSGLINRHYHRVGLVWFVHDWCLIMVCTVLSFMLLFDSHWYSASIIHLYIINCPAVVPSWGKPNLKTIFRYFLWDLSLPHRKSLAAELMSFWTFSFSDVSLEIQIVAASRLTVLPALMFMHTGTTMMNH